MIETFRQPDSITVCKPLGNLDWPTSMTLRRVVADALVPGETLTIDLARVTAIEAVGLSIMLESLRRADTVGATIDIRNARAEVQWRLDLVMLHKRYLTENLALRFANRGESLDALVQVASYGLLKAVDCFDSASGIEFSTYATHTIVGEIKRHVRDRSGAIRAERRMQELYVRLGKVVGTLGQELGRSPTIADLANDLAVSEEEILEALEAGTAHRPPSLAADNAADDETQALAVGLGEEDVPFADADDRATLFPLLAQLRALPSREQRIIELRFFERLTPSAIAVRLGISPMHVSRLLAQSVAHLRALAGVG